MGNASCGVPEERWVDWHTGNMGPELRNALGRHLETCAECRLICREWGELLGAGGAEPLAPALPAAEKSAQRRRRLRGKVRLRRMRRWLGSRGVLAAAACAFVLLASAVGLFMNRPRYPDDKLSGLEAKSYAEKYEPSGVEMMARPDTVSYRLAYAQAVDANAQGVLPVVTVWVNGRTEELFLLVDGLLPSDGLDLQAWGTIHDELTNLGVLEFHNSQGHLYSRAVAVPMLDEVEFTIEPKGGSERPTAPESVRIRLAR